MEEKDASEDGGEGGEVPQVEDGADQGHAAQLPVVAGDRASFKVFEAQVFEGKCGQVQQVQCNTVQIYIQVFT